MSGGDNPDRAHAGSLQPDTVFHRGNHYSNLTRQCCATSTTAAPVAAIVPAGAPNRDPSTNAATPVKPHEPPTNHTRRIFVVDDDPAVRHSLTFVLGTEGYDVAAFSSGADVLKEDIDRCACMVIDYRLPDMNGLDLADRLRSRGMKAPAILITSLPPSEVLQRAAAAGVRVIEKPLINRALRDAIHAALD